MKLNGNISDLAKALIAFQGEVSNPKNTAINEYANGHRYAPLGEILSTVRPILAKHGLAVVQDAKIEGRTVVVTTTLFHESGQFLESEPLVLPAEQAGKGVITAQTIGAAITYGRRYQLSAILGISSEDDDDANSISIAPDPKPSPAEQKQKNTEQSSQPKTEQKSKQETKQQTKAETKQKQPEPSPDDETGEQYTLVSYKEGKAPSGVPFAKFDVVNVKTGEKITVLAKDASGVELAKRIPKDKPFSMEITKFNNFNILKEVNGVSVEDLESGGAA